METHIIYKKGGYTVSLTNPGRTDTLLVFMSGLSETGPRFRRFAAEAQFVAETGASAIFVRFNLPTWYQGSEARAMLQAVALAASGYHRVVVVGSDMGAYGAMAFAEYTRADHVIAFSPIATIDPRHGPRDWRFDEDFAVLRQFRELRRHQAKRYTVFYDSIGPEARHLEHLRLPIGRTKAVAMPGATGQSKTIVQETGLWDQVLRDALAGKETVGLDRASHAARRTHPEYLRGMALANMETRPRVAKWAIDQLGSTAGRANMARQLEARYSRTHATRRIAS